MMTLLYALAVHLSNLLIPLFWFINPKSARWVSGRKGWKQKLEENFPVSRKVLWFHAASLGEFEQGKPLIEEARQKFPDNFILVTFFSPSGYEVRKNYKGADLITYLPLDTPSNVRFFLDKVNPSAAFFIKYEFWYFFLKGLYKRRIPVYLVSGIFRKDHIFFKWYGTWFRRQLQNFTFFFLQNKESQELLNGIGLKNTLVSGDTRFDTVAKAAASAGPVDMITKFVNGQECVVAGSTWPEDEALLSELINDAGISVKFIIAPHEIHKKHIEHILSIIKKDCVLYSEATLNNAAGKQVLIIDNIGMLLQVYKYATLAYVGGGFGKGIHNILEPAAFGAPVIIGPNYHKFREASDLVKLGGAFPICTIEDLTSAFNTILKNTSTYSSIVKKYAESNTGATNIIFREIFKDTPS